MREIDRLAKKVESRGVDCVVISNTGEMVPFKRAYQEFRLLPDFALVRGDGWALGVPAEFSNAINLGENWVAVVNRDGSAIPYRQWAENKEKRKVIRWGKSARREGEARV